MKPSDISISFEIEPIVKLSCTAFDCKNNLAHNNFGVGAFCILKYVGINPDHTCSDYDPDGDLVTNE
jgi:hypothetical protein